MGFVLRDIIEDIHNQYALLPKGRPRPDVHLGNLEQALNADCPRIVWMFQSGTFGASTLIGGPDAAAYQALASFNVWIWQVDLKTCWTVMVDLLAAMRQSIYGPNLGAQNFTIPTEKEGRHQDRGEVMVLTVTMSVPIPLVGSVPPDEVELQSHESTVTAENGESGVDLEVFETVLVTGPPA